MAQLSTVLVGTMTVAVGASTSNVIHNTQIEDALQLTLIGPTAIAGAATGVLEVPTTVGGSAYSVLQSPTGTDWAVPLVNKNAAIPEGAYPGLRIKTNANVTGADAVWTLYKKILV